MASKDPFGIESTSLMHRFQRLSAHSVACSAMAGFRLRVRNVVLIGDLRNTCHVTVMWLVTALDTTVSVLPPRIPGITVRLTPLLPPDFRRAYGTCVATSRQPPRLPKVSQYGCEIPRSTSDAHASASATLTVTVSPYWCRQTRPPN